GLGVAFIAPLAASLIDSFKWQTALLILGGIAWLVIIPVAQLLKRDPYVVGSFPDGASPDNINPESEDNPTYPQKISLLKVVRTMNFWSFLVVWLLMAFSGLFVMTHIVPHSIDLGFSATESAAILSFSGITMIGGRLFTGIITDKWNVKTIAIIGCLLQAATLLLLVWAQDLWILYIFGAVHGFVFGGFGTSISVLIGRSFGLGDIGKILGALEVGIFIGAAIGPLLGGYIFDTTDSYQTAFLIMIGTVLARIPLVIAVRQKNRE
ncbi:MFS transporter, partial [Chloroflexota bacterium]